MKRAIFVLLMLVFAGGAQAADEEDALAFFNQLVSLTNQFNPEFESAYADEARILTMRDGTGPMEMSGAQWKQVAVQVLEYAKKQGDTNTFANVKVSPHGEGWRITADRTSALKCYTDTKYHMDIRKVEGAWRVFEEYAETISLPLCKPSEALTKGMTALVESLSPKLPLALDANTRLDSVEIRGVAIIYSHTVHTVSAAEIDLPYFRKTHSLRKGQPARLTRLF